MAHFPSLAIMCLLFLSLDRHVTLISHSSLPSFPPSLPPFLPAPGMIAGQLLGGFLGDALGLSRAFKLTMLLQVGGAIGSTLVFPPQIYWKLAVARFFLGVGAGGVYPLAAAMSSNASSSSPSPSSGGGSSRRRESSSRSRSSSSSSSSDRTVALVFALQGVAFVTMNALATLLAYCLPLHPSSPPSFITNTNATSSSSSISSSSSSSDNGGSKGDQAVFRFLLAFGALPGLLILLLGWVTHHRRRRGRGGGRGRGRGQMWGRPGPPRPSLSLLDDVVEDTAAGAGEEAEAALTPSSLPSSPLGEEEKVGPGARAAGEHVWLALRDPVLRRRLVGCSLTWFLYDVCFFGNTLFQPVIGTVLFGKEEEEEGESSSSSSSWSSGLIGGGGGGGGWRSTNSSSIWRSSGGVWSGWSRSSSSSSNSSSSDEDYHATFRTESQTSLILALIALPGYFLSVYLIARLGPRYIQTQGFLVCALLYLLLACVGDRLANAGQGWLAVLLFGLSFTFFNFGPGATTYLYPSKLFPKEVKASLNGVAAAAGKVGGWVGGYCFPPLLDAWGLEVVLALCAVIALLGAGVTVGTLERDVMKGGGGRGGEEQEEGGGRKEGEGGEGEEGGRPMLRLLPDEEEDGEEEEEEGGRITTV